MKGDWRVSGCMIVRPDVSEFTRFSLGCILGSGAYYLLLFNCGHFHPLGVKYESVGEMVTSL